MTTIVISDLHLGSRFCHHELFVRLLGRIPRDAVLVLNGDIVHNSRWPMPKEHRAALDLLCRESFSRRIVWVRGNHDLKFQPAATNKIDFVASHAIGKRLFVTHGAEFVPVARLLRVMKAMLVMVTDRIGRELAPSLSIAKRVPILFYPLKRWTMTNAVRFARENGYEGIACGHIHTREDLVIGGIRYINTGTWTETPTFYLEVSEDGMALREA